jgi:hypothetical protein
MSNTNGASLLRRREERVLRELPCQGATGWSELQAGVKQRGQHIHGAGHGRVECLHVGLEPRCERCDRPSLNNGGLYSSDVPTSTVRRGGEHCVWKGPK